MQRTINLATYQAVVNPDIVANEKTLKELFAFMEEHKGVGQAMPAIVYPDGSEQRLAKRLPTPFDLFLRRFLGSAGRRYLQERFDRYETRDVDLSVAREIPALSGCFMFLRSSVLREIGLFDERYFMYMEDVDLCRRVGAVSRTVIVPTASAVHAYAKGSYNNKKLLYYHMRSALSYFMKWGWWRDRAREEQNQRTASIGEWMSEVPELSSN